MLRVLVAVVSAMATADRLEHDGNSDEMGKPFMNVAVVQASAGCMVRQVVWTAVQQFEGSQHGRRVGRRAVATKQNLLTLPSPKMYAQENLM